MKKKLVTLKEALPAMVRVFCRHAKGDNNVWNYAIKNDGCINHYIYFTAEKYMEEEFTIYEGDGFYTKMFEDIYGIVYMLIREKIPMMKYDQCLEMAWGIDCDFERADMVMGVVLYILETLDVRKDKYYLDLMDILKKWYRDGEKSNFYKAVSDRLSIIKDEPHWCADEKKLSDKTQFEIEHDAWVVEFFGESKAKNESNSDNALTAWSSTPTTSLVNTPPFKNMNDAVIWEKRIKEFFADKINTKLNSSKENYILRCMACFLEVWQKQDLLIKKPNRDVIRFLERCGFKRDGVTAERIAGVLGELIRRSNELCEEKELVRTYIENTQIHAAT